MAGKLIQRGKVWYLRYTGADGRRTMKRLSTDRRVAEELARDIDREQDRLRAGWIDPRDLAYRDHEARPIREHAADYLRSLPAKGVAVHSGVECGFTLWSARTWTFTE
jgi:hypothetical protein